MNKKQLIKELKELNEVEYIKVDGQEQRRTIFKQRDKVFELFGKEEKEVLNPFNDYTYEWLNSFLNALISHLENNEDLDSFEDILPEHIDSEVDVYTSGLTTWLSHNNNNTYYLDEAVKEGATENILMVAQYKAIEELFYNALTIIKEEFDLDED